MYQANKPHNEADVEPQPSARSNRRTDEEVVVDRRPIIADGRREDRDADRAGVVTERRRSERRTIDRMGTGI